VHPPEVRAAAEELIAQGVNDCEISRRLGIPRGTIRDWRRPTYVPRRTTRAEFCPRCWRKARRVRFTPAEYAELLGLYLGDGCISEGPRTFRLRITLDLKYPRIIKEAEDLVARCFPENRVDVQRGGMSGKCANVSLYSRHLPCLFPQHASGKKHERPIVLEAWQLDLIEAAPGPLLRGLICTDGCVFINRTDIHRPQPYEYLSYAFANKSKGHRRHLRMGHRAPWD
jgi:hypothetical protein